MPIPDHDEARFIQNFLFFDIKSLMKYYYNRGELGITKMNRWRTMRNTNLRAVIAGGISLLLFAASCDRQQKKIQHWQALTPLMSSRTESRVVSIIEATEDGREQAMSIAAGIQVSDDGYILVNIESVTSDRTRLLKQLKSLGGRDVAVSEHWLRARLPISSLRKVLKIEEVKFLSLPIPTQTMD